MLGNSSPSSTPPSKIPPSKTRRKKGEGTGYIYSRTITRKGKHYPEFYYRYRDESGKLRSKYISQKLLDRVREAESLKLPVTNVLRLLGGDEISRGEQHDISQNKNTKNSESNLISRGERTRPPSTRRRKQGYGGGYKDNANPSLEAVSNTSNIGITMKSGKEAVAL